MLPYAFFGLLIRSKVHFTELIAVCMQEYDLAQFDAFCICLECEAKPHAAFCDWFMELSLSLIRPDMLSYEQGSKSTASSHLASASGDDRDKGSMLRVEERFPYFVMRVAQAHHPHFIVPNFRLRVCVFFVLSRGSMTQARIWSERDGVLFERLQTAAAEFMEEVAARCNMR